MNPSFYRHLQLKMKISHLTSQIAKIRTSKAPMVKPQRSVRTFALFHKKFVINLFKFFGSRLSMSDLVQL